MNKTRKTFKLCLLLVLSLLPGLLFALQSDKNQPVKITSDKAHIDSKKHVNVFTGNVIIVQGTTKLEAQKVVINMDQDNKITEAIATGKRVHYYTIPEKGKKEVVATADEMRYYAQKGEVILIGDAVVTQADNTFRGPRIVYNVNTQIVTSTQGPGKDKGRTTIVIVPNKSDTSNGVLPNKSEN